MEYKILTITNKLDMLQERQNIAINIIKAIEELEKEKEYYNILVKETEKVAHCDTEIDRLQKKLEMYRELNYEYFCLHYQEPEPEEIEV